MRGAVLYGPRDVRFEERETPTIINPTAAVIRIAATCVCGSDLWPYRGIQPIAQPTPMGHEYCGIVEEVGSAVTSVKRGQFVIGSFFASDNTCPNCQISYQSSCQHAEFVGTAQAPLLRVPLADGTLVATPDVPTGDMIPSLLALSDVMGTGWFLYLFLCVRLAVLCAARFFPCASSLDWMACALTIARISPGKRCSSSVQREVLWTSTPRRSPRISPASLSSLKC